MLETCQNQAAGLQCLAPPRAPRLLAMASHGDQSGEMAMLWRLCASWIDMGLSVLVFDGNVAESAENPGLLQHMDNPLGCMSDEGATGVWVIQSAAQGLAAMIQQRAGFSAIANSLQKFDVVMVYARPNVLTQVLKGSGSSPLLVITPPKASAVTAYQAVKQMYMGAYLRPTVANIALEDASTSVMTDSSHNLQSCVQSFLGFALQPVTISTTRQGDTNGEEIQRLALQLLESAVILDRQHIARTH